MHSNSYSKLWDSLADVLAERDRGLGGLLRVEIIGARDHFAIASAAFNGDRIALYRTRAIIQSDEIIKDMQRDQPATCLCCPDTVTDPFATVALLAPATNTSSLTVCSAVCPGCPTATVDEVLHRMAAYRAQWPALRCADMTHPQGGAS